CLNDEARLAPHNVEPVEAGIGVGLHDAAVVCEMFLGMLPAAVGRVVVERCRSRPTAEGLVVAYVGPQPPRAALAPGEHRNGRVVGVDACSSKDVLADLVDHWH